MKKGNLFEKQVVEYLQQWWPGARRLGHQGRKDCGDVGGIPGIVLELKNCRTTKLAEWTGEAEREAANAGVETFAVVHKRVGKTDPGEQWVTLPLRVFADMMRDNWQR